MPLTRIIGNDLGSRGDFKALLDKYIRRAKGRWIVIFTDWTRQNAKGLILDCVDAVGSGTGGHVIGTAFSPHAATCCRVFICSIPQDATYSAPFPKFRGFRPT